MVYTFDFQNILTDALSSNITFDYTTKRYRYKGGNEPGEPITGSFVSRYEILKLQEKYLEVKIKEFIGLQPRIETGEIGVYKEAAKLLKEIHLSNAILAADGIDNLNNGDLGMIGSILKKQYYAGKDEYTGKPFGLKHLFKEVEKGLVSPARLKQRLTMYTLSGEISYDVVKTKKMKESGYDEEIRDLGIAEHCEDCIRYAGLGWQPIGTLPSVKTRCKCRTNCRCKKRYRKSWEH